MYAQKSSAQRESYCFSAVPDSHCTTGPWCVRSLGLDAILDDSLGDAQVIHQTVAGLCFSWPGGEGMPLVKKQLSAEPRNGVELRTRAAASRFIVRSNEKEKEEKRGKKNSHPPL